MFTQQELELIAELCKKFDVVCVADEVYEWMTYPGYKHLKIGKNIKLSHNKFCMTG